MDEHPLKHERMVVLADGRRGCPIADADRGGIRARALQCELPGLQPGPYLRAVDTFDPQLARMDEAADLLELRNEAARWQTAIGLMQWAEDEVPTSVYEAQIARAEWYVIRHDQRVLAGLRLVWQDEHVWGPQPPVAAYVHHLVCRREPTLAGVGAQLLCWAGSRAVDHGRHLLRLDCQESNLGLRSYYRGQGFREVGRKAFDPGSGWWPVARFEKQADHRAE